MVVSVLVRHIPSSSPPFPPLLYRFAHGLRLLIYDPGNAMEVQLSPCLPNSKTGSSVRWDLNQSHQTSLIAPAEGDRLNLGRTLLVVAQSAEANIRAQL